MQKHYAAKLMKLVNRVTMEANRNTRKHSRNAKYSRKTMHAVKNIPEVLHTMEGEIRPQNMMD